MGTDGHIQPVLPNQHVYVEALSCVKLPCWHEQCQVLIVYVMRRTGPRKYYPKDADSKLAVVWLILVQPLLFGAIGIEIDFRLIQGSLIWKTVVILALGDCMLPPCLPGFAGTLSYLGACASVS